MSVLILYKIVDRDIFVNLILIGDLTSLLNDIAI